MTHYHESVDAKTDSVCWVLGGPALPLQFALLPHPLLQPPPRCGFIGAGFRPVWEDARRSASLPPVQIAGPGRAEVTSPGSRCSN